MRIAIYQCEPRPAQVDRNLERLARIAKHASTEGVDLLVCPEMYLTGYNIGIDAVRELAATSDGTSAHAVAEMTRRFPDLDVIFIESGGDNLAATFSPDKADLTLYVVSVCQGEKIPRKGGPAITRSDLLIINKTDLAPHVGADLSVMERDSREFRRGKPFCFTNLKTDEGLERVIDWVRRDVLMLDLAS